MQDWAVLALLVCVCGERERGVLGWAVLAATPRLPELPRPVCSPGRLLGWGSRALDWQWLTAEVAGWLQCKSNFSCFISASWVLFCNGGAGVIYWVNLHFSDVARAVLMTESQLRRAAVPRCSPARPLPPGSERHQGLGLHTPGGGGPGPCSRALSPHGEPCLATRGGAGGLPTCPLSTFVFKKCGFKSGLFLLRKKHPPTPLLTACLSFEWLKNCYDRCWFFFGHL